MKSLSLLKVFFFREDRGHPVTVQMFINSLFWQRWFNMTKQLLSNIYYFSKLIGRSIKDDYRLFEADAYRFLNVDTPRHSERKANPLEFRLIESIDPRVAGFRHSFISWLGKTFLTWFIPRQSVIRHYKDRCGNSIRGYFVQTKSQGKTHLTVRMTTCWFDLWHLQLFPSLPVNDDWEVR